MVSFLKLQEYATWYASQTAKVRAQIDSRLEKIRDFGHYGHVKKLSSLLFEIKFNNGNRIYYTEKVIDGKAVILILGGNKNGQDKDIKKAQKIAEKIHSD
jgi:putative addiction module killer protein